MIWIPFITLLLATASDSGARRRRRLAPPDWRWFDLQYHATDLVMAGMSYDLMEWLIELGQRAGVPPLLDGAGLERMRRSLRDVPGARVIVDRHTGFWSVRQGDWLVVTEPWSSACLIGMPGVPAEIPASTGDRVALYRCEAERRRRVTGEGVPLGAQRMLADLWLPASYLRPNPLGLDYNVVQVSVWKVK
jgi:hypothetical protein